MIRIGVDAGGTFTDFVVLREDGRLESFKLRSNPAAPEEVILAGLARAAGEFSAEVVHGSTVATNALLERKGARTAFLTTSGFEDLLEIGRQHRAALYDLTPPPKRLLVPPDFCFGVEERTLATGEIEKRPAEVSLRRLRRKLERAGVESIAICLLHSYRRPDNERTVAEALAGSGFLSVSSEVCPEFREYERASTTVLNAYVGPLMGRYLGGLSARARHPLWIMQSNGGALTVAEAGRHAVRTILSGPAGGVTGAMETGRASGFPRVLGFDMGGTSTDVSLCDGYPRETTEARVDGLPVKVPMLEIHTVGAGGGSIARIDEGGLLRVGPESAGADPGPACYGKGRQPTVTDAHVVLGRIGAEQLAGGSFHISPERSREAIAPIAERLGVSVEHAASGILRIANATMTRAIRLVSVERGYDPRDFALVAFGGCGGLHACEIAGELGIRTVLAPRLAGALSALGMLLADRVRDAARGVLGGLRPETAFEELEARLRTEMPGAEIARFADLRYRGQSYELTVPWDEAAARSFEELHAKTYDYAHTGREVEVVTVRVRARQRLPRPSLQEPWVLEDGSPVRRRVHAGGEWMELPVYRREHVPQNPLRGPALVADYGSTTLASPGWTMRRDSAGCLILERAARA